MKLVFLGYACVAYTKVDNLADDCEDFYVEAEDPILIIEHAGDLMMKCLTRLGIVYIIDIHFDL